VTLDLPGWLDAVRGGVASAGAEAGAFAHQVSIRALTTSTNDDVTRAAATGAPEGYTVIAAEQSAGRGRRGASWHSPSAQGLYLSTLLRPDRWAALRADAASPVASLVTLMAGVVVARAIGEVCAAPVELKWPNDVMVRTSSPGAPWRKLAGILAEGTSDGGVLRSVVLGIGLNLTPSAAPAEVAVRMISLDQLLPGAAAAGPETLTALVRALLVRLREGTALLARGAADEVREQWRRCAPSVEGTVVRWRDQAGEHEGHAAGIDDGGALRVRRPDGGVVTVHGGDVEWRMGHRDA